MSDEDKARAFLKYFKRRYRKMTMESWLYVLISVLLVINALLPAIYHFMEKAGE